VLQEFSSETVDSGSLETTGSFKLTSEDGMDVKYTYCKSDSAEYSFESNFDLAVLADVKGVTVSLEGDNKNTVKGKVEYKSAAAAVSVGGGKDAGDIKFPFSVGLAPVAGLNVGVSGTVLDTFKPEQLYESVSLGYAQKGLFTASAHLTGNFGKVEARGTYDALDGATVGLKVADLTGKPAVTVGGDYEVDSDTQVKVVVEKNGALLKAGVAKSLGKGCELTVGYAVAPKDIADPSKHKCGFVLDVK